MGNRQHGITKDTYKHFSIDQGAVYANYGTSGQKLLGATRGDNKFSINQEIRSMPVDGAKGPVKGEERVIKVEPIIEANIIEWSTDILKYALPGSETNPYPSAAAKTHDILTRSLQIDNGDYIDSISIVGECTGSKTGYIIATIYNALAQGNFDWTSKANDEAVNKITFRGHFDPSDLDTEPWDIKFPVIA